MIEITNIDRLLFVLPEEVEFIGNCVLELAYTSLQEPIVKFSAILQAVAKQNHHEK